MFIIEEFYSNNQESVEAYKEIRGHVENDRNRVTKTSQ